MAESRQKQPEREDASGPDSAIAALLEQSRAGAESAGEGSFRLDWSRALDKIKRFQLTDPHRYVLELVQAGVAAGAEQIEIETDADDVIVSFGGAPLTVAELRGLFDFLFAREVELARNRQLALGVNAALALDPKRVSIEIGDGARGARLSVRSHTDLELVETRAPEAIAGTRVHVRERKGWKVLVDAVRRRNAEDRLLIDHCRFAPVPIRLNGKDLRRGLDVPHLIHQPITGKGIRGVLLLPIDPPPASELHLCTNGVEVVCERLEKWEWLGPIGVVAHVDSAELDRNASHTAVRHDNAYRRVLRAFRRAARDALQGLVKRELIEEAGRRTGALEIWPPRLLHHLQQAARVLLRGRRKTALPDELEALLDVEELLELPFEDKQHGALRPLWRIFREKGKIPFARRRFEIRVDDVPDELKAVPRGPMPLLRAVFHDKLDPVDDELEAVEAGLTNRRRREAMRREAKLPRAGLLVKVPVRSEEPPVSGELGLSLAVGTPPGRMSKKKPAGVLVTFLREGVPLGEILVRDQWLRGRAVLESPDFEPTPTWDGVARNAACQGIGKLLGLAVLDLLAALREAFPRLTPPAALRELPRWDSLKDEEVPLAGWEPAADWPADAISVAARLHAEALLLKAPRLVDSRAPWIFDWPLFVTLDGRPRSLAELRAAPGKGGAVRYVSRMPWGPVTSSPGDGGLDDVVNVSSEQRRILRRYLPARQVKKQVERARKALAVAARTSAEREANIRRAERRRQVPKLDDWSYLATVDLPAELGQGQVGIPRQREAASWLRVLVEGLPLCELKLDAPLPVQAVIESEALEADEEFSSVKPGLALGRVRRTIAGLCDELAAELVRAGRAGDERGRQLVWTALEWLAEESQRRRREREKGRGKGKRKNKGAGAEKRSRAALEIPEPILSLPLVRTVAHGLVSLDRLVEIGAAGERVRWIDFEASEQRGDAPIVIIARPSQLSRLGLFPLSDYRKRLRGELEVLRRMRGPRRAAVLEDVTVLRQPVRGPQIEGVVGIPVAPAGGDPAHGRRARIEVLADGRPLEVRTMSLGALPLCGVLSSPRFAANERFDAVVEDEAWQDALRALRLAVDRLVVDGCERLGRGGGLSPERRRLQLALQMIAGQRFCGTPRLGLAGAPALDWTLARAPLFWGPGQHGPDGAELSLERIARAWVDRGRLLVVDGDARGRPAPGRVIVSAAIESTRAALVAVFGADRIEDGGEVLARDEAAWSRREQAPLLEPQLSFLHAVAPARLHARIDGVDVYGEVGLARADGETEAGGAGIRLRVGLGGRVLCRRLLPHALPAVAVVEARGLEVDEAWTELANPDQVAALEVAVERTVWDSVAKVARRADRLERWSAEDRERRRLLVLALGALVERPKAPAVLERLAVAPLFQTVQGQAISAKQLLERRRDGGRVLVVGDEVEGGDPEDDRLIVRADGAALGALRALLGEGFERYDEAWADELRGRERRRSLERSQPGLATDPGAIAAEVRFEVGPTRGVAGMLRPSAEEPADAEGDLLSVVRLHIDGRPVATVEPQWHPRVEVWVNDDRLQPNRAFDGVADDAVYAEVLSAAESQIPELLARAAERWHDRWVEQPGDPLRLRLCHAALADPEGLRATASAQPGGPAARLLDAPLWRQISPGLATTRQLLDAAGRERLARVEPEAVAEETVLGQFYLAALAVAEEVDGEAEGDEGEAEGDAPWLVLVNDGPERAAIERALGSLPDHTTELMRRAGRAAFLRRRQVSAVSLETAGWAQGIVERTALDGSKGWRAELGLLAPGGVGGGEAQRTCLRAALFVERRLVCQIELESPVAAVAAVEVEPGPGPDRPTLRDDHLGFVEDRGHEQLREGLAWAVLATLGDLARRCEPGKEQPADTDAERGVFRRLLLAAARRLAADEGSGTVGKSFAERIASVPLVEIVGGERWPLERLRSIQQRKLPWVSPGAMRRARAEGVELGGDLPSPLLLLDAREWSEVAELLPLAGRPLDDRVRELTEAALRRRRAPQRAPMDWSKTVARSGAMEIEQGLAVDVALAVPFGPAELALFSGGALVEQGTPRKGRWLGLVGEIDGPFATDDAFRRVAISGEQRQAIGALYETRLAAASEAAAALDGAGREGAEGQALLGYAALHLRRLLGRAASGRAGRREIVQGARPAAPPLDRALSVALVPLVDGSWVELGELLADEEPVVVLCGERSDRGPARPEPGVTLARLAGGPVAELIESVLEPGALIAHDRWKRDEARRAKRAAERAKRRRSRTERELSSAVRKTLRELVGAARRHEVATSWLDLPQVERIRLGDRLKGKKAKQLGLVGQSSPGAALSLDRTSGLWQAAVTRALGEGGVEGAAMQLCCVLLSELRGLTLAGGAEVSALLGVLASIALSEAEAPASAQAIKK